MKRIILECTTEIINVFFQIETGIETEIVTRTAESGRARGNTGKGPAHAAANAVALGPEVKKEENAIMIDRSEAGMYIQMKP